MRKILFLDSVHPFVESELSKQGFTVEQDYTSSREEVAAKLHEYYGLIIRSRFKINKEFLSHPHQLKFIGRYGAGLENIDTQFAESKGVHCIRVPEGNRDAVGEQAIGMLLMLLNNLKRADAEVRKGIWRREENRGYEISGKTVGVLGYGYMGSAMHEKLQGFGCNVLVFDKYLDIKDENVKQVELDVLFQEADIISVHIPFTVENQFWLNREFWSKFKKQIYLINTARGDVLKISDLMDAIEDGKILGACLDVLEFEKSSFENLNDQEKMPLDFVRLINSEKVILSPHIAGWTHESYDKLARTMVSKILALD